MVEAPRQKELAAIAASAPKGWERGNERTGDTAVGSTGGLDAGDSGTDEGRLLQLAGFDPESWEIVPPVHYREWDAQVGGGEIRTLRGHRFNARRRGTSGGVGVEELLAAIERRDPPRRASPAKVDDLPWFVFAASDWQVGKFESDPARLVERITAAIRESVETYRAMSLRGDAGNVHIAFLGDEIEGFVSQGGKNIWRTTIPLTEQIRIIRRLMLEAVTAFAEVAPRVTVVAVPSNHGQAIREPGITTYDDDHGVEALVSVADALALSGKYPHVETFVPKRDSQLVTLQVGSTVITHAHGHQWRTNKHFDWWKGWSFEKGSDPREADILLCGHGHHLHIETSGTRTFVMAPSSESESTWFKNGTGTHGNPGTLIFTVHEGKAQGFTVV